MMCFRYIYICFASDLTVLQWFVLETKFEINFEGSVEL